MKTPITRADQDVARLDVKLAERLGEPVDPRVRKIAEMDRSALDRAAITPADLDLDKLPYGGIMGAIRTVLLDEGHPKKSGLRKNVWRLNPPSKGDLPESRSDS